MTNALEVRNGYKYYGSGSHKRIVLNYLDMCVPTGAIYGLLGASGCGKTTLLSCIVGQKQLNYGDIRVLGMKPGLPGSGVPGPLVGYMPQDIALVNEMTVKETIYYFGRICGMNDSKVKDRYKILKDLLELPPSTQLIRQCSGGQQRRVSFACAMVHDPQLLILDEPTVGLDPILRERIWDFLVDKTKNKDVSVIITTHYIEEARQANCIGLMRNGVFLAEASPDVILRRFETNSLENAFLILSQHQEQLMVDKPDSDKDNQTTNSNSDKKTTITQTNPEEKPPLAPCLPAKKPHLSICRFTTKPRIKALLTKNKVQFLRQPLTMLFMVIFPLLQLTCFYMAIGHDPTNLKLGVVNYEVDDPNLCYNDSLITVFAQNDSCSFHKLSCRYLQEFNDMSTEKIYFNTETEAYEAARRTDIIGYIHFSHNFSESMQDLLELGRNLDEGTWETSTLNVHVDMSYYMTAVFVSKKLGDAYLSFSEGVMTDCGLDKNLASLPVHFEPPIYGTDETQYQRYVAPGVIMTLVFFLATLMASSVFINERAEGIWDRTLVSGISTLEMLTAHLITQTIFVIILCAQVIFYLAVVFNEENRGDNLTVIGMLFLCGLSGMLFGMLISIYCKTHTMANFVATGAFYPLILLCGVIWPIEGMPYLLQKSAMLLPFTLPAVSTRNIIEKGWSITNFHVYNGFIVMIVWTIVLYVFCIIGLKRRA